jgi:hypothetical protein
MTTFNSRTESPTTSANGHSFMQELYGVKRKWHDEEGTARPTTTVARPDSRQAGDTGVCSRGGGVVRVYSYRYEPRLTRQNLICFPR